MVRWFDVGQEAQGVVAIGQLATGVIAIGQVATGVIAIGQLARGVFVVGQLAVGVVAVGMGSAGVVVSVGMLGIGGTARGLAVLSLLPRRTPSASPSAVVLAGVGEVGAVAVGPRRFPLQLLLRLLLLAGLAAGWWWVAGAPLLDALLADGGVLRPVRVPR